MAMRLQHQKSFTMTSEQEKLKSRWCWFTGSSELKDYYFEGMFDLPDSEDHTALQYWRDPEFPKLRIHPVTQWVVRTPPKKGEADENADLPWIKDVEDPTLMEWLPACMKPEGQEACSPQDVTEIELMNVSYISMIPEINVTDPNTGKEEPEMGLKFVFPDGSSTEFVGGVYLPRNLMVSAMQRAEENYGKFSGLGQEARDQASDKDNMLAAAIYAWRNTIDGSIKTGVGSGAAAGASIGVGIGAAALLVGAPGLGAFAFGTFLAGAGVGLVGGTGAGLALGAVLGTIIGGGAALSDYHKQKKELGYSAVEKMWDKLECHSRFVHCSKTLIVPQGKACPEAPCAKVVGAVPRESDPALCKCKSWNEQVVCPRITRSGGLERKFNLKVADRKFNLNHVLDSCPNAVCSTQALGS